MNLVESYQLVKPSIVAFSPKFYFGPKPTTEFPPIFGTGFIVSDGLVATNAHVLKMISKLPKPPNLQKGIWPVECILFHNINKKGVAIIPIDVLGAFGIKNFKYDETYMGPKKPDIAFIHVKMKNLPAVNINSNMDKIKEGTEIATAGFPMGEDTLTAPGYLHQLTHTLQRGIISAVLPFPCKNPHSIMINIMVQGGASGSPVFLRETGEVIGVLYASLEQKRKSINLFSSPPKDNSDYLDPSLHQHYMSIPTNISYVVPAHYINKILENIEKDKNLYFPNDTLTLEEFIANKKTIILKHRNGIKPERWKLSDN